MSAVNVIIQSNAVHVLTDGIGYSAAGAAHLGGPKLIQMPHLRCAIAFRGPRPALPLIGHALGACAETYDGLKACITGVLKQAAELYDPLFRTSANGTEFEVIIAGWTDDDQPDAYLVASSDRYVTPWTVIPIEGVTALPNSPECNEKLAACLPGSADEVDPVKHGLEILEIQRSTGFPFAGFENFCVVGSFAQLTTIRRDEITTKVIRRWNDVEDARAA